MTASMLNKCRYRAEPDVFSAINRVVCNSFETADEFSALDEIIEDRTQLDPVVLIDPLGGKPVTPPP